MSIGAVSFYVLLVVVSIVLFDVTYRSPVPDKERTLWRNMWRACIVALSTAALLVATDSGAIPIILFFVFVNAVYVMEYGLTIDPHPIVMKHIIGPVMVISVVYMASVWVVPWNFYEEKHGIPVKDALTTLLAVGSIICTYTPPGRWFWRKVGLLRPCM